MNHKKKCLILMLGLILLVGCANRTNSGDRDQEMTVTEKIRTEVENNKEVQYNETAKDETEESGNIDKSEKALEANENKDEKVPEVPPDKTIYIDQNWDYVDFTASASGSAMLYRAQENRKDIVVAVDAGHGTTGAKGKKIYCHPDKSKKTTGGSTAAGSLQANAQSEGMAFRDGTNEGKVTLQVALLFKDKLLDEGFDVLMLREEERVELDPLARTIMANFQADCHISIHFDGDNLDYDKGAFYISVPDGIKQMPPVDTMWQEDDRLGECLIEAIASKGIKKYKDGYMAVDLMQTSYSTIPSVDMELGNQCTDKSESNLDLLAEGLLEGVKVFYNQN